MLCCLPLKSLLLKSPPYCPPAALDCAHWMAQPHSQLLITAVLSGFPAHAFDPALPSTLFLSLSLFTHFQRTKPTPNPSSIFIFFNNCCKHTDLIVYISQTNYFSVWKIFWLGGECYQVTEFTQCLNFIFHLVFEQSHIITSILLRDPGFRHSR